MDQYNSAKRLSSLQKAILAALPAAGHDPDQIGLAALRPTDLIEALGKPKDNSSRASMSRALSRLRRRGLIETYEISEPLAQARWPKYARGGAGQKVQNGEV